MGRPMCCGLTSLVHVMTSDKVLRGKSVHDFICQDGDLELD